MSLDKKKKHLELARVRLARQELELKIDEREEEIIKLKEFVAVQLKKEAELENELSK